MDIPKRLMSQTQNDILKRALDREKAARKQAEKILEKKSSELFQLSKQLKETNFRLENLVNEKTSQLQGVFENIIDAYIVFDLLGNIVKMNDAALKLLDLETQSDTLNLLKIAHPNEQDRVIQAFKELLEKGSVTDFYVKIITSKGLVKWVHINCSLVYKNKEPIAAQGIARDMTESRIQDELIQDQKGELDVIVNNSAIGIVLTQKGHLVRTNKLFQDMTGYTEEELQGLTIKDLSLAEDFPKSKVLLDQMIRGEVDNFTLNKRYKRKNGSIIWAKTNVNAVRDKNNVLRYQVALIEDITSERETELNVNLINNVTKSILDKTEIHDIALEIVNNLGDYLESEDCVIFLINPDTEVISQIATFGSKQGSEKRIRMAKTLKIGQGIVGAVVKTGVSEIIPDTSKDDRYVKDKVRAYSEITVPILSKGKVIAVIDSEHKEKNYYTKNHVKTLEKVANLVAFKLTTALDVIERKKAEDRNELLLKELETSNNELKEYAHVVSHDLKSPLRAIDALTAWLKEDYKETIGAGGNDNIDLIRANIQKMDTLISGILEYSTISGNKVDFYEVDTDKMVDDILEMMLLPPNISIVKESDLPSINGDKHRLQQLFQNLIDNAIKYNDKEEGLIEIGVEDENDFWKFYVKDNGKGIEKAYFVKIFETFQKLENNPDSSGIGLSIVNKIVKLYGGKVWVESQVSVGTTFFFTLKK